MAIQYINTGSSANAGNGDSLRSAFIKVNNNFTYLSTASFGGGGNGYTGSQGNAGYTGSKGDVGPAGPGTIGLGDDTHIAFYEGTGTFLSSSNSMKFIRGTTSTFPVVQFGDEVQSPRVVFIRNTYSNVTPMINIAQYHEVPDANNFTYFRARGTISSPATVQIGDDLADINFLGWDGVGRVGGASISATVEDTPTLGQIPTKLSFGTSDGTTTAFRAELSFGIWKIDKLSHLSTTTSSIVVSTNLIPASDLTYDLGSTSSQWRSLHVGTSTIYLGGTALSVSGGNLTVDGVAVNNENLEIDGGYASAEFTTADLEVDGGGA